MANLKQSTQSKQLQNYELSHSPHQANSLPPFFILGCGRSGTSLLGRILDSHPRLSVPAESHLFNIFQPWINYYGDLSQTENRIRLVDDMLSTVHIGNWLPPLNREQILPRIRQFNFGGVFEAVLQTWADNQNKPRWGEKTPQHIFYWREILHYFPKARIIHMVRDGRDVTLSFIRAKFGPKTVYAGAKRWSSELAEIRALKTTIHPDQFYELRYEDLLDNPKLVLAEVCQFIGEDFSPEMLNFYQSKNSYYVEKVNKKNLQSPLLSDNKKKWKTQMSANDLTIFEAVAQDFLLKYGYEPARVPAPSLSQIRLLYHRFIENPPRKLVAMARNKDGHKYELTKLKLLFRLLISDRL